MSSRERTTDNVHRHSSASSFASSGTSTRACNTAQYAIRFASAPLYLSWVLVAACVLWVKYTPTGLWVSFAGEHPEALDAAGIRVNRVRWMAVLVSGALAGMGGASLSVFLSSSFSRDMTAGRGFMALAACVLAPLVGIGGGLIHVPVLTYVFNFPLHIATATSHFVLFFTALAGVVEHVLDHTWPTHLLRDSCLAVGVVGGAQLGAFLSRKISAPWIVLGLAIALGLVGVRLVMTAF